MPAFHRKLIRVLADEFHVRIEMRQIGARQRGRTIGAASAVANSLRNVDEELQFRFNRRRGRCQDIFPNPKSWPVSVQN